MSEEIKTSIRTEGDPAFPVADTENDNSASSSDDQTKEENNPSSEGDNTQNEKQTPLNENPRWKEREEEWKNRFNTMESRHQEEMQKILEKIDGKDGKSSDNLSSKIPSWFGGDQEQWDEYRADRDAELKQAREDAIRGISEQTAKEKKAVDDATEYMNSEISSLESDTELNPTGEKIDPPKLLKIVLDNDLIDSKGRWNYRAGYRIYQAQSNSHKPGGNRKDIAGATTSESKAETKPSQYKTHEDFKQNRPW